MVLACNSVLARDAVRRPNKRAKTLKPVRANAGVEAEYYRDLMRLIDEMERSVHWHLRASYRKVEPSIVAQDAAPASVLNKVMDRLTKRWRLKFNDVAEHMARKFVGRAQRHSDASLSRNLRNAGFSVKFKVDPSMVDDLEAAVHENVGLIKSIAEHHLAEVNGMVMRSAIAGRDLATLTKELQERAGITRRRAAFIARDQNNKATAFINRTRQMSLGITEAEWAHSHGGKHPRESHVKAGRERLRYRLDKGAYIDGEWIFPGEKPNCRCVSRPIIPGFDN